MDTMKQTGRHSKTLDGIEAFTDIIDVRSPSEYNEDHIPRAVNLPVLNDEQRREIGEIYTQVSKHEAKCLGAAMISVNIAGHLRTALRDKPPQWAPLVYCWRGGNRSAALTHVMRRIGWKAEGLAGGYKTYRRLVLNELEHLPGQLRFTVLCGKTGVGKSRLLRKIESAGGQILDLEALANHRGSVLGEPQQDRQPSQKSFESLLCHCLRRQDPARVIYTEAESQRIGLLRIPDTLMRVIRAAPCWDICADIPVRAAFLADEYRHFVQSPGLLKTALEKLVPRVGYKTVENWLALYERGEMIAFIGALLTGYYDPLYTRSIRKNYQRFGDANTVRLSELGDDALTDAAAMIIAPDHRS